MHLRDTRLTASLQRHIDIHSVGLSRRVNVTIKDRISGGKKRETRSLAIQARQPDFLLPLATWKYDMLARYISQLSSNSIFSLFPFPAVRYSCSAPRGNYLAVCLVRQPEVRWAPPTRDHIAWNEVTLTFSISLSLFLFRVLRSSYMCHAPLSGHPMSVSVDTSAVCPTRGLITAV